MPSYEKNKSSGLWSVRFRETSTTDGTTHQKRLSGFKTKKDAQYGYEDYITEQKRADEENKRLKAIESTPKEMLFDDLVMDYLAFTKKRVKESSYYDIESKIKNRLLPFFAGKTVQSITPKMISDWIEDIDYSYSSKAWIFSTMASIYKYGYRYYDIKNIMDRVDRPRNMEIKKELSVWTPEEFNVFIEQVDKEVYALYFKLLYITGCRRGEALALTWNDVDLELGSIKITKSVTNKTRESVYKITTPKHRGSVRTITAPIRLVEELRQHLHHQQAELKECWHKDLFVFDGARPLPTSSADHIFAKAIKEADVKKIRIHDLRHSCASLLISRGVSVVAVSKQLGHSNVEQTLNTYAHIMPDDQTLIKDILESVKI